MNRNNYHYYVSYSSVEVFLKEELNKLREKIDLIDDKILTSILQRAEIVKTISSIKATEGVDILKPGREIDLLENLYSKANTHLDGKSILYIWREIISTITNSVQSSFEIVVADKQGSELGREVRNYYGSKTKQTFDHNSFKVIKEISESKNLIAVLPIENDWWLNSLPMNIYIFSCLPVFENNCLGFLLGQVKPERARNNKSILVCNEESKNWISQKYNFTIISNLQDKFMISVDEYYEDIEIKGVSILGSFGYIKTG